MSDLQTDLQTHPQADPRARARLALACLDLTSLGDTDAETDVAALARRAEGPHGNVAAVCVWPRFAAFARARVPASIAVAAVANFPAGDLDPGRALRDIDTIAATGAQEVDAVLPYRALIAGDTRAVAAHLATLRRASHGLVLKLILETGALRTPELIDAATRLALDAGADFVKTSTGKTATGATPEAARTMLAAIAALAPRTAGFKASGGIRTLADAAAYIDLAAAMLGAAALTPARFRIGASSLLADIERVLAGGVEPATRGEPH